MSGGPKANVKNVYKLKLLYPTLSPTKVIEKW